VDGRNISEPTGPARPTFARSASYGGYESAEAQSAKAEVADPMTSSRRRIFERLCPAMTLQHVRRTRVRCR